VLGIAAYLLWTWYQGHLVRQPDGAFRLVRDEWRLWTGLPLLAWSFLGRYVIIFLLARRDEDPTRPDRGHGLLAPGRDGATLYFEASGPADAPPLVLTHGWSLDSTIWFYAKRDLARRFRVIAWDLPGLGQSKVQDTSDVSLSQMAQNLRVVLALAGRPAILVGHSIGGMTIETLARDNPELFGREIAGVVLVNTTYTNPLETIVLSRLFKALRWPVIEPMMHLQIWLHPLAWLSSWQSYLSGSSHLAARLGFSRGVTRSQLEHTTLLVGWTGGSPPTCRGG
jgi:pimeloyl-ACP methyl ester carboxylesterase